MDDSADGSVYCGPSTIPAVTQEMDALYKQVESIIALATELGNRIAPLLAPDNPRDAVKAAPQPALYGQHASSLWGARERLGAAESILIDYIDRLQI